MSDNRMADLFFDLALAASADGTIDPSELSLLGHYRKALGLDEETEARTYEAIDSGEAAPRFTGDRTETIEAYRFLRDIVHADGVVDPAEETLLSRLLDFYGLKETDLPEDESRLEDELDV